MIGSVTLPELCRFFESTCVDGSFEKMDLTPGIENFSLHADSATGVISASDSHLYSVKASWIITSQNHIADIKTDCDCFTKRNCQHGAAFVAEILRRRGDPLASVLPKLTDKMLGLLQNKSAAIGTISYDPVSESAIVSAPEQKQAQAQARTRAPAPALTYSQPPLEVSEITANFEDHGQFWFSMELGILVDGKHYSLLPILVTALIWLDGDYSDFGLETFNNNGRFIARLPDRTEISMPFDRIKFIVRSIVDIFGKSAMRRQGHIQLTPVHYKALERYGIEKHLKLIGARRLKKRAIDLAGLYSIKPADQPKELMANLRPYQKYGVGWLQELSRQRIGGILADDMGLGKTIQVLAHLLASKEAGLLKAPALVVCPRSVVNVWISEAKKFAPTLNVADYSSPERDLIRDKLASYNLIVTTYNLVSTETEQLKKIRLFAIIADESQNIKNHLTQAAWALRKLKAGHRVCLTGTPVENSLTELWSQFDFLVPGLLGDLTNFKRELLHTGSKAKRSRTLEELKERIRPFILRRLKEDVARELPAKTTILKSIPLSLPQRDLYEAFRLSTNRQVQEEIASRGIGGSQLQILAALMKLRQVCCDPGLVLKKDDASRVVSAKLRHLLEMVRELHQEGRKVIIFSQFTRMLSIIAEALNRESIDFVELTGKTRDRKTPVDRFQNGDVPVFLISLRAGGSGLTLTAADTVIHYDPWWNPQVENQATDRAYRIGQDKPVFVYKLIARGTIEERILDLQKFKDELARDVLDFKKRKNGLTQEEVDHLLAPGQI